MGQRRNKNRGRAVSILVAMSLVAGACSSGDSGGDGQSSGDSAAVAPTTVSDAAPTTMVAGSVELIADGHVSDEAIAAVATDGVVDAQLLSQLIDEIAGMAPEAQLVLFNDLSTRLELEAAAITGLTDTIGDPATAEAAIIAAWGSFGPVLDGLDTPVTLAVVPAGFLNRPTTAPSASGVGVIGIAMGLMGLTMMAETVIGASNDLKPGEHAVSPAPGETGREGLKMEGSIEQSRVEMEFDGPQDAVAVKFKAVLDAHPCPDANGQFEVKASINTSTSKGASGHNSTIELHITGQVDDNADLVNQDIENHTQWADFDSGKGQFLDITMGGKDGLSTFDVNRTGGTVSDGFVKMAVLISGAMSYFLAGKAIDGAKKAWQSGRCVNLGLTPSDGPTGLDPSAVVSINAAPRSKIDGLPTGGKITANLSSGGQKVEPDGSPLAADADFTYTAPDEADKSGSVKFESRSKRGVGKADLDLDTKGAAYVASGGTEVTFTGTIKDLAAPFTLVGAGTGFTVQFSFTPTNETSGSLAYAGSGGGTTINGTGTYTISGTDPDLILSYNAQGCANLGGCRATSNAITLTRTSG